MKCLWKFLGNTLKTSCTLSVARVSCTSRKARKESAKNAKSCKLVLSLPGERENFH